MAAVERISEQTDELQVMLHDALAESGEYDMGLIDCAYVMAVKAHAGQLRASGEPFIVHPVGVALILAGFRLDSATIAAALLHDAVEDSDLTLDELRKACGADVASLVEGVTKLTHLHYKSKEQAQAANYRKLALAMAEDVRVILIKLADRLHNMRTIEYVERQKQVQKATETLEVYAPIASRLGIFGLKAELEDRSFAVLYPRAYSNLEAMVNEQRDDRERYLAEAAELIEGKLDELSVKGEISGRAKHLYSVHQKMALKQKEFNEIFDLLAVRVIIDEPATSADCYAVIGAIHSLWRPLPDRFKDYIALPKLNLYQSLHTTVIGPEGHPLEIQVRTREMHERAELGVAAHWIYKAQRGPGRDTADELAWLRRVAATESEGGAEDDPNEFLRRFRAELVTEEVYVFTPQGELKSLPVGSTPIDFAYAVHTEVGHRMVGAKVNGRIVPLSYQLNHGDRVEITVTKAERGPSRDWLHTAASPRARRKIQQWFSRERREDDEQRGRESLETALKSQNLPRRKVLASPLFLQVVRELGFSSASDLHLAIGQNRLPASTVVSRLLEGLKRGEVAPEPPIAAPASRDAKRARTTKTANSVGIEVEGGSAGIEVRLARCCAPVPGDPIVGYISVGKGISVHHARCSNLGSLAKSPERLIKVSWEERAPEQSSFRVQITILCWDRPRLLESMARTFAEHGANVVSYSGHVEGDTARNWYVAELSEMSQLRGLLNALRALDGVFDAYRVTPSEEEAPVSLA